MDNLLMWFIAILGAGALIGVFYRMKGGFGPQNLRAFGIVLIGTFATLLATKCDGSITAAMGILGGIAGYLFGTKDPETPKNPEAPKISERQPVEE
jgi:hypothetical protein